MGVGCFRSPCPLRRFGSRITRACNRPLASLVAADPQNRYAVNVGKSGGRPNRKLELMRWLIGGVALATILALWACAPISEREPLMWTGASEEEGVPVLLTTRCSDNYKPWLLVELLDDSSKVVLWQARMAKDALAVPDSDKPNITRFVAGKTPSSFEETVALSETEPSKMRFRALWHPDGPTHIVGALVAEIVFERADLKSDSVAVNDGSEALFYVTEREFYANRRGTCASLEASA